MIRTKSPWRTAAILTLALALPLAACGGDDSDGDAGPSAGSDAPAGSDTPAGEVDRDDGLCAGMEAMRDAFAGLDDAAMDDPALLQEMAEGMSRLRDQAPDELEADFATVTDFVEELAPLLPRLQELTTELAANADDADRVEELTQEMEQLQADFEEATEGGDFEAASERISTYAVDVCGIEDFDDA